MSKVFTRIGAVLVALAVFLGAYVRTSFIVSASGLATTKPTFGGSGSSVIIDGDVLTDILDWCLEKLEPLEDVIIQGAKAIDDYKLVQITEGRVVCRAFWTEIYKLFENDEDFITFIDDLYLYENRTFSHPSNPYDIFIEKYGSDFEVVFQSCVSMLSYTFAGRGVSGSTLYVFYDSTEELIEDIKNFGADYYVVDGQIIMPASDFKEALEQGNTLYTPKNATGKVSFKNDKRFHNKYDSNSSQKYLYADFYENGFFSVGGGNDIYLMFFYKTDTEEYYSQYQFHFFIEEVANEYDDRDEYYYTYNLKLEAWDMINSSREDSLTIDIFKDITDTYFDLWYINANRLGVRSFNGYLNYVNFTTNKTYISSFASSEDSLPNWNYLYNSSDFSKSVIFSDTGLFDHFKGSLSSHSNTCDFGDLCDVGYVASSSPILRNYNIDTSKIPDNYYITTNGDTIYNYTITNPETGESDSITNYVTNNYTYITNNNGGSGTGSGTGGSLSGDITVGGNVNVGGQVDVNVNVNVNDNGGSSGAGQGTSFGDVNTDPMDDYLNEALEESSGFRKFMADFFAFLPPEILVLLGIGLTFVIMGRIMGR